MTTPIMPSCMKAPVQQMLGQLGTSSSESSVPASACSTNQRSVLSLSGLCGPITGQYFHYLALLPRPGHVDVAVVQTRELVTQDPAPIRDQYCGLWTNQKVVLASSGPIRGQYWQALDQSEVSIHLVIIFSRSTELASPVSRKLISSFRICNRKCSYYCFYLGFITQFAFCKCIVANLSR